MTETISLKTRVMVWGRAAGRCALPTCRRSLVMDSTDTDDASLVGEVAHIVAEKPDGPRGASPLTEEERCKFDNLILLCRNDHKMVDDRFGEFTVVKLHEIKQEHENWIQTSLPAVDVEMQRSREICASYVEHWADTSRIGEWDQWTSGLLAGEQPWLDGDIDTALTGLRHWLFSRVWPVRCESLRAAMENFRAILQELQALFHIHADKTRDGRLLTRKFYQNSSWNERYEVQLAEYEKHVTLVQALTLELTRAANWVCDIVRRDLDTGFRMREGLLTVVRGPDIGFSTYRLRPEYRSTERGSLPYPGLREFEAVRETRDIQ